MYMLYHRRTRGLCHFMPLMYRSTFNVRAIYEYHSRSPLGRGTTFRAVPLPFPYPFSTKILYFISRNVSSYNLHFIIIIARTHVIADLHILPAATWKRTMRSENKFNYYWLIRCKRKTVCKYKNVKKRESRRFDLALSVVAKRLYLLEKIHNT
jgi:hypothetical protein